MRWPGKATTNIAIFSIRKGQLKNYRLLGKKKVNYINSFLSDDVDIGLPFVLNQNQNISYEGSKPDGMGFILSIHEANLLLKISQNKNVIYDYLTGDDVNDNESQEATRKIINFFDWPIEKAKEFVEPFQIVLEKVKPYRATVKDKPSKEKWWQFARPRPNLYKAIKHSSKVLVISSVTKHVNFIFKENKYVFSSRLCVINQDKYYQFAVIQSSIHFAWISKYSTTMDTRFIYNNTNVFENFPFLLFVESEIKIKLDHIGELLYEFRIQLMLQLRLGLTKSYNAFHAKEISEALFSTDISKSDKKTIEKQLGKEVWYLWNHLHKTENACSIDEALAGIIELRKLHVEMDYAVLEAYGWQDIDLRHDFYEVDYLPENDRVRFTIHPDARKEVLKRLLELNHKIHEEEVKAGLWDKKKTKKKKSVNNFINGNQVNEPGVKYGGLFGDITNNGK